MDIERLDKEIKPLYEGCSYQDLEYAYFAIHSKWEKEFKEYRDSHDTSSKLFYDWIKNNDTRIEAAYIYSLMRSKKFPHLSNTVECLQKDHISSILKLIDEYGIDYKGFNNIKAYYGNNKQVSDIEFYPVDKLFGLVRKDMQWIYWIKQ